MLDEGRRRATRGESQLAARVEVAGKGDATHEVVPLEALCGERRRLGDGRAGEGGHREDGGELEHLGGSTGGLGGWMDEVRLDRREVRRAEQSLWRGEGERGAAGGEGQGREQQRLGAERPPPSPSSVARRPLSDSCG